jgi:hypothetical protein
MPCMKKDAPGEKLHCSSWSPSQLIPGTIPGGEHSDCRCVPDVISQDSGFVACFRSHEEDVVEREMGFHFLGSRGKVGSAGLVALAELVHKGACEEPVFPERWNDA